MRPRLANGTESDARRDDARANRSLTNHRNFAVILDEPKTSSVAFNQLASRAKLFRNCFRRENLSIRKQVCRREVKKIGEWMPSAARVFLLLRFA